MPSKLDRMYKSREDGLDPPVDLEWRNWTDKCVVGWHPIENTT